MRKLLTALLCLIFFNCIAQRNTDSLFLATMKSRKISLSEKPYDTIYNLPFHDVQVIDARPDTTSIGFLKYSSGTNKLYLEKGLANSFKTFIRTNYKTNSDSNNLLIIIKEFRITDYAVKGEINGMNVLSWNSGAVISTELFLNNSTGYHALYKIDSVLIAISNKEMVNDLVAESFRTILKKTQNKNLSEMHIGKTTFSSNDIKTHIEDFANLPILKSSILNKGVYKSFNEFKTNNPSITNFEVRKGQLSDELFVTDGNQSYPLQDFWGYCDGKKLFVYSAKNLFQLIRAGNTFNVKGIKSLSETYKRTAGNEVASSYFIGVPMSALVKHNYTANPTAFQLNMQNGELY